MKSRLGSKSITSAFTVGQVMMRHPNIDRMNGAQMQRKALPAIKVKSQQSKSSLFPRRPSDTPPPPRTNRKKQEKELLSLVVIKQITAGQMMSARAPACETTQLIAASIAAGK